MHFLVVGLVGLTDIACCGAVVCREDFNISYKGNANTLPLRNWEEALLPEPISMVSEGCREPQLKRIFVLGCSFVLLWLCIYVQWARCMPCSGWRVGGVKWWCIILRAMRHTGCDDSKLDLSLIRGAPRDRCLWALVALLSTAIVACPDSPVCLLVASLITALDMQVSSHTVCAVRC